MSRLAARRHPATTISPIALAVRLVVLPLTVLATLLTPHPTLGLVVSAGVVAGGTVFAPATVSALPVLGLEVIAWAAGYRSGTHPAVVHAVLFADVLYLIHTSAALAATIAWSARVDADILRAWAIRCWPALLGSIAVAVLVTAIGDVHGSLGLVIAGLVAVLVTAISLVRLAKSDG